MKLLISVDFLVYHHSSVVYSIGLVNRTCWVQIRRRLLLKVTEIIFLKSYFYQKMIFHLLFVHLYLSYVTSFFIIKLFRLDLKYFIQVWWATLSWNLKIVLLSDCPCVCTLYTFSSSPKPLDQFRLNLIAFFGDLDSIWQKATLFS